MYVISILFLTGNLLFAWDTTNLTKDGTSVINSYTENQKIKLQKAEALSKQEEKLTAMGISSSQCDNWKSDKKTVQNDITKNNKVSPVNASAGSCANPNASGEASWSKFLNTNDIANIKDSCCVATVVSLADVQTAYSGRQVACDNEFQCPNHPNDLMCTANEGFKITNCVKVSDSIKKRMSSKVESNCNECKIYKDLKSSLGSTVSLLTQLGILIKDLTGKSPDTKETVKLSCDEKCSQYAGKPDLLKACKCQATYTLPDGSTQPCLLASECAEDTTCAGKKASMQKLGYCSGQDCDDIESSCKCTEVASAIGSTKRWDPVARKCVDGADGTGNEVTYTNSDPKYTGAGTSTPASKVADTSKGVTASGTGTPATTGATSPAQEAKNKAAAAEKDKAKFGSISNKGSSQFKNPQGYNGGGYGGSSATEQETSSSQKAPVDIVEAKGPDIWKVIRDIYQTGIDANRFMEPKVASDKSAIKKSKKKSKTKGTNS
ncbi:MAG: hypothetical protein WCQ47_01575 [bacterium]